MTGRAARGGRLSDRQRRLLEALHRRKGREKHGLFLVEGPRLVAEALAARWALEEVFFDPDGEVESVRRLLSDLERSGVPRFAVTSCELRAAAGTVTPQGILATARRPEVDLAAALRRARGTVLIVDGVQDPGNVGALLRTADAYGVSPVLLLRGTADPLNPKAIRGAMGAIFHIEVAAELDAEAALDLVAARGFRLLGAVPRGGREPEAIPAGARRALAVGGEGGGLSARLLARRPELVTIRTPGRAESLNVVVAAGILLDRLCRPPARLRRSRPAAPLPPGPAPDSSAS
ncbi:MAG: RNA methyltransferase [Planctomycetes bacterium]|nr:RNA methyltransferase [Planctomycetota bacterium]